MLNCRFASILPLILLAACGDGKDRPAVKAEQLTIDPLTVFAAAKPVSTASPAASAGRRHVSNSSSSSSKPADKSTKSKKKKRKPENFSGKLALVESTCTDTEEPVEGSYTITYNRGSVKIEVSQGATFTGTGNQKEFEAQASSVQPDGTTVTHKLSGSRINEKMLQLTYLVTFKSPDDSQCAALYEGFVSQKAAKRTSV